MLIVDSLIIGGVKFVLTKLAEAVEAEMYDESSLREELLAAQMKLELGEIDEREFESIEAGVLAGLREIAARKEAASSREGAEPSPGAGRRFEVESVSADFDHRDARDRR
jgi:hypothetical protein